MSKPSVIFLGSKPGATVALELLLKADWEITAVVPSGSHPFIEGQTVEDFAAKHELMIIPQRELPSKKVDFVISYMFRDKVTRRVLSLAKRAALNFHAGPLPEYAGWAFYNLAILERVSRYGCTCHHMDEGFDTGPLLKVRWFQIDSEQETAISLERKSQEEMILLFRDFIDMAESGDELPSTAQNPSEMRYLSKKEFDKLKKIPQDADEDTVQRIARAFFYPPYECAYVEIENVKIEVLPKLIKWKLAENLHKDDLPRLRRIAGLST